MEETEAGRDQPLDGGRAAWGRSQKGAGKIGAHEPSRCVLLQALEDGTLGCRWAREGHEAMFGVREPSSDKVVHLLADVGERARAGTVAETAAFGEVVALANPWSGTEDAVQSAGDLTGKVLLGAQALEGDRSATEQVAAWAPGAKAVKIFNTTGFKVVHRRPAAATLRHKTTA